MDSNDTLQNIDPYMNGLYLYQMFCVIFIITRSCAEQLNHNKVVLCAWVYQWFGCKVLLSFVALQQGQMVIAVGF